MQRALTGAALAALVVVTSCSDGSTDPGPTQVIVPLPSIVCAPNADWIALKSESDSVLTEGSLNATTVRSKLDNLERLCAATNVAAARQQAVEVVHFVVARYESGVLTPIVPQGSTPERETVDFINHVLASAIINVAYTQLANSWIVNPSDPTKTLVTTDGLASITVAGADVDSTTLITAESLAPSPGYLQTDLDQYARYYRFNKSSGEDEFKNPVTVAICVLTPASMPDSVFNRLRIGAQHSSGFEVTAPSAPPSGFECTAEAIRKRARSTGSGASASIIGDDGSGLVERGGVGGLADNFSDFGVIDPEISARGGVGGLADNFRPRPGSSLANEASACTSLSATPGAQVDVSCRPMVTFQTAVGETPLDGIPVTFTVLTGGGQVAVENPDQSCGAFSSSVTTTSAPGTGVARVCWILGAVGANTVGAKAANGGDAINGTYFLYSDGQQDNLADNGIVFSATALPLDASSSVTGGTFTYDGQPHGGTATCNPSSLTPVLTYSPGGSNPPVNGGTYTVTATCGGGSSTHVMSTASATILIMPSLSVTTLTCEDAVLFTGAPRTPCSASVAGSGGFTSTVSVNYANNLHSGVASAEAAFPGDQNHVASFAQADFTIQKASTTVEVNCSNAVYSGAPHTGCLARVMGAGGLNLPISDVAYSNNVDAGAATASAAFPGGPNHEASSGSATFNIARAPTLTTVTCANATYTSLPITTTCSARVTGAAGLDAPITTITYHNNVSSGNATGVAQYAGTQNQLPSFGVGTFFIAPLPLTATAGTATIEFGAPAPVIPCAVTGALPGDAGSVTCQASGAYTVAGTFPVVPQVTPTPNYTVTKVNGSLTVHPFTQVGCFETPLQGSLPPTSAGLAAGSPVSIVCTLQNSVGAPVSTGRGDIEVRAAGSSPAPGADPSAFPLVFAATNVFAGTPGGEHLYALSTSGFSAGAYYHVTVRWSDGTTTTGWFYLN